MQPINIKIEFDNDKRQYRLDDTLKGTVTITINSDKEYRDVNIVKMWRAHSKWRTHGKALKESATDSHAEATLYQGRLKRGEHSFDFELPIDEAPLSYHGENLDIDWYLMASVTDAKGAHKTEEIDFVLKENPDNRDRHGLAKQNRKKIEVSFPKKDAYAGNKLGMLVFGSISSTLIGLGLYFDSRDFLLFGGFIAIMVIFILYRTVTRYLSEKKLGNIKLSLEKSTYSVNENINIQLMIRPNKDVNLNQVKAVLQREEHAEYSTYETTSNRTVYHTKESIKDIDTKLGSGEVSIKGNRYFSCNLHLTLPSDSMYSFNGTHSHIQWRVVVYIDIKNSPDWSKALYIKVIP